MHLAYIAGPYRAPSIWEVKRNIEKAELVAIEYWKKGYAVICPHKNTALLDGSLDKNGDSTYWIRGDLEILKRCDVCVMMPGWQNSEGATQEHGQALRFGLEIIYHKD